MIYKIDGIVKDVRVAIDQNMQSDALLMEQDIDTLALEEIIESKIEEAIRRVESSAPLSMLDSGHNFGEEGLFWDNYESGFVILPDDFMRLMSFKMSDWEKTITQAITEDSPLYAKQSSRYKGVRGNWQKPVVAIVNRPEGRVLEFYSCKDNLAEVIKGTYRPYPKIEDGAVEISERCYMSVIYTIASLVSLSMGEADQATGLIELSKSILEQ